MKTRIFFMLLGWSACSALHAQSQAKISVQQNPNHEICAVIDAQIHLDYGAAYPLTYQLNIPAGSSAARVFRKDHAHEAWAQISEKTSEDFFNGVEAVRFDYVRHTAYVSAAFSDGSDSLSLPNP